MIKIQAGKERETIDKIRRLYTEFNPGIPFDYKFLDKDYQALYESEQRVSDLSKYFETITIAVAIKEGCICSAFSNRD